ncbi:LysR family transcriptional regulator [Sphingobium jiangsuense]|uniref:DNA-binding transcriptional LysR family regulator n=1 Tax=Sphingobium jiangsuense TaxID=870476 RepID=A0A7W6BKX8_9SPHN|nr:LysR family transcriptional regulator [Sphingobium jiangsuense]MBB3927784.1 DNA-binding transcriptional LysR family regulator [Sphingobium jiangsuense]GLT00522.1 LysR family transcriptional regulator [Sphingobium jiangsuense]
MDFRRLDLNLLLIFDAMIEERSTVAVARRLRISQPTVSVSLAKLRDFFRDELFVRGPGGMQPTAFAQSVQGPIRRIVDTVRTELFREGAFDPATSERCFTFSTSDIGELVFLPALLEAVKAEAPGVTFQCLSMRPAELQAAMATGTVDLALGYFPDLTGGGFYEQRLFEHPFTCLVRADHPLIGDTLSLDQFLAADHLVVEQEGRSQEIFERRMEELGLRRHVVLRSPHFMSVPLLVANSDILTTVPYAVGRIYAGLARLRLLPPPIVIPSIRLKQLWHRRVHGDAGVVWLRQMTARLFLNRDPTFVTPSGVFDHLGLER